MFPRVILLLIFCLPIQVFSQKSLDDFYHLMERNMVDSAKGLAIEMSNKENASIEWKYIYAKLLFYTNQTDELIRFVEAQKELENMPSLLVQLSEAYKFKGDYKQTKIVLNKALAAARKKGDALIELEIEALIKSNEFAIWAKNIPSPFIKYKNEQKINSSSNEFGCQFYNFGVLFSSDKSNLNNKKGEDLLYYTKRINYEELEMPMDFYDYPNLKSIQNVKKLAPAHIHEKSNTLYCSANNLNSELRQPYQMSLKNNQFQLFSYTYSKVNDYPYFSPVYMEGVFDQVNAGFPFVDEKNHRLYFSATKEGMDVNYGGYDIYYSEFIEGVWSKPINAGKQINTKGNEICAFITEENQLYFSSDGYPGFGGFDIYATAYQENIEIDIRNLGALINSPQDDIYCIFDSNNKVIYFSSNRTNGMGGYDIYSASLLQTEANYLSLSTKKVDSLITTEPNNIYIGQIMEKGNNRRIENAEVCLFRNGKLEHKLYTDKNGEFKVKLPLQTKYSVKVSSRGYENINFEFNSGNRKGTNRIQDNFLIPNFQKQEPNITSVDEKFVRSSMTTENLPNKAFYLRIGSFVSMDTEMKRNLSIWGNLYTEPSLKEPNATVYSLGAFANENHAVEVLQKIMKTYKLKDCFVYNKNISKETMSDQILNGIQIIYPKSDSSTIASKNQTLINASKQEPTKSSVQNKEFTNKPILNNKKINHISLVKELTVEDLRPDDYLLQIGAFKYPNRARISTFEGTGLQVFKRVESDGLTKFYLYKFKTKEEAEAAKSIVFQTGLKSAFIVSFDKGIKISHTE